MKDKTTIRYVGFRSAEDGGRIFEFDVSESGQANVLISVEIPKALFGGADRIQLQEGVGICYEQLRHLFELGSGTEARRFFRLTDADLAHHRQAFPVKSSARRTFQSRQDSQKKIS